MKLVGRLVRVEELTPGQRDQMFRLMDRHYRNMVRDRFEHDLAEKQWVILISEPCGTDLCGFSTQVVLETRVAEKGSGTVVRSTQGAVPATVPDPFSATRVSGRPVRALFSGDTIIDRGSWGDNALARTWGRLALELIDAHPDEELYWFLISKGYKTYRFLPLFFHEFYPRWNEPAPPCAGEVIAALARERYPHDFDPVRGVVRARPDKDCLREEVAPITADRLRDPHVCFFVERNPGHAAGDELCCLAPLTRANFTPAAYRVIGPEPAMLGAGR